MDKDDCGSALHDPLQGSAGSWENARGRQPMVRFLRSTPQRLCYKQAIVSGIRGLIEETSLSQSFFRDLTTQSNRPEALQKGVKNMETSPSHLAHPHT